jgi:hemoglobin-like flavoprotein
MELNIRLLKESFALVLQRAPRLTERFYDVLLERHPHLAPMFPSGVRAHQPERLAQALTVVVSKLDDGPWLARTLGELGRRHEGYGVTPEMYACVGEALLFTLREAAGELWNTELDAQWHAAYVTVARMMCADAPDTLRAPATAA